jgi:hypothetical protein
MLKDFNDDTNLKSNLVCEALCSTIRHEPLIPWKRLFVYTCEEMSVNTCPCFAVMIVTC